jgi:hypothetical protein
MREPAASLRAWPSRSPASKSAREVSALPGDAVRAASAAEAVMLAARTLSTEDTLEAKLP